MLEEPYDALSIGIVGHPVQVDNEIRFVAEGLREPTKWHYEWSVRGPANVEVGEGRLTNAEAGARTPQLERGTHAVHWRAREVPPGLYRVKVRAVRPGVKAQETEEVFRVDSKPVSASDILAVRLSDGGEDTPLEVALRRSDIEETPDVRLWEVIERTTRHMSFDRYFDWMETLFCRGPEARMNVFKRYMRRGALPFPDVVSYKALKVATEAFLMAHCGVAKDEAELRELFSHTQQALGRQRFGKRDEHLETEGITEEPGEGADRLWHRYLVRVTPASDGVDRDDRGEDKIETLPYLALVRQKLPELRVELNASGEEDVELCYAIMGQKLTSPCFLELLWCYWHEQGMLSRTIDAITLRFQNRSTGRRDPLAGLALDPLRPLNNLIWGYVQDEQHRLTLARRAYEYDHEYGLALFGRGGPPLSPADSRSRFLEAFHTLLHRASVFYRQDDDTTTIADPFPLLNALSDVHLLLAEGAHNAYGDLPWTARQEMLIQQWLLARPELREFLPTRTMVVYPEPWMDRVDAMRKLQGWGDTSVRYFHDLAVLGEQLLLTIRYGNWSNVFNRNFAGNWARYWREQVQWYIHAYETVTGVNLSADTTDVRGDQSRPERFAQPALLMQQRTLEQRGRLGHRKLDSGTLQRPSRRRLQLETEYEDQPSGR